MPLDRQLAANFTYRSGQSCPVMRPAPEAIEIGPGTGNAPPSASRRKEEHPARVIYVRSAAL
jgi:hypothetical protein